MSDTGYPKSRFLAYTGEMFDCHKCKNVVKEPKQCQNCGNLFCAKCIQANFGYIQKQYRKCTNITCQGGNQNITNMSAKALINIYNDLDVKCLKCNKTVKLGDLAKHEGLCGRVKCQFYQACGGYESKGNSFSPFCSNLCMIFGHLVNAGNNAQKVYEILSEFAPKDVGPLKSVFVNVNQNSNERVALKWSESHSGQNVAISNDNTQVFLKEEPYVFRTVVSSQGFTSGRHYWEIHADNRTENQLKIGVSCSNVFQYNTAFCDYKFGFAYYGLGQLRHGSNSTGGQYGKRFKKTGILGVYLNMDRGTLSFSLNGEDFGVAYEDEDLKKGPIYASVALLHCSGCTIKGELPIPVMYQGK